MAELKELIQRKNIRTMKKDLARLRLSEAETEKERITKLKVVEEAQERLKKTLAGKREPQPAPLETTQPQPSETKAAPEQPEAVEVASQEETEVEKRLREAEERIRILKEPPVSLPPEARETSKPPIIPPEETIPPLPSPPFPAAAPAEFRPSETKPAEPLPPLEQRPSRIARRLTRALVIILIFLGALTLFTFVYWFFWIRGSEMAPEEIPAAEEEEIIVEEEIIPTPPPPAEPPPPLISVEQTLILEISSPDELSEALKETLLKGFIEKQLTRILVKNTSSNQFLELNPLLNALSVITPSSFAQKLGPDFELLLFSQKQGNRLGWVAKIVQRDLADLLSAWEKTMEKDSENFFLLISQEKQLPLPPFRTTRLKGVSLRYQTFSRSDLGIVYAITKDYFIFTSSFESMAKILEILE